MDILLGHFVGDWFLQNDWIGLNKSEKDWICALHSVIYTLAVMLFTGCPDWRFGMIVAFQHFIFDRDRSITEFLSVKYKFKWASDRERMWLVFFYDNISHLLTVWLTLKLLGYRI
jgi:hypothetical protein